MAILIAIAMYTRNYTVNQLKQVNKTSQTSWLYTHLRESILKLFVIIVAVFLPQSDTIIRFLKLPAYKMNQFLIRNTTSHTNGSSSRVMDFNGHSTSAIGRGGTRIGWWMIGTWRKIRRTARVTERRWGHAGLRWACLCI